MATLKQAKLYKKQAQVNNKLLVNDILFKASQTYFKWLKAYQERRVYGDFLDNAELRFKGIKKSFELGEIPAIDTTEARIAYNNRKLNLEKANLNYIKTTMELSNFLWINDVPVEVQNTIIPDTEIKNSIDEALQLNGIALAIDLENHPKLKSLDYKFKGLKTERLLKRNNLLPQSGLTISFPLFLRKERADLKLVDYKLQAIDFDSQATSLALKNKLNSVRQEINSYENQIVIAGNMVSDYSILLQGEERKFEIGESSLFLINSRESKLIENKLKLIELENIFLNSKGKLFNILGI